MACTACIVDKVSYVSGCCKKPLLKQALVAVMKQSRQANKAVGPACFGLGLLALFCARY